MTDYTTLSDEELKAAMLREEAAMSNLNIKQNALKVFLNSGYGAQASPFFRFFDFRCAEGITSSGQFFIKTVGEQTAEYIDGLSGVKDSLIYSDTDSEYLTVNSLIKKCGLDKLPKDKLIDAVDKICEQKIGKAVDRSCGNVAKRANVFENHLAVKREKISESAIFVQKKAYVLLAWDNEGVRYTEPEISATGLEVKRSSTPKFCRNALADCLRILLTGTERELQAYVKDFEKTYQEQPLYEIAIPSGVKGLDKYADAKSIYKQGCPKHVRASLLYNHYLKTHNIAGNYPPIQEGGKMRRVALTLPNPIGEDTIGFVDKLPPEFGLDKYVDLREQFEGSFIKPLERVTKAISWSHEQKATLDDFFG